MRRDFQTSDTHTIVNHLIRVLLIHRELVTSEDLKVPPNVPFHKGECFREATFDHLLEDERLEKVSHVARGKCSDALVQQLTVIIRKPLAALGVPRSFVACFLFNLDKDALDALHCLHPLFRFLEEALIEKEPLAEVSRVRPHEERGVNASNVFIVNSLFHHFLNLIE